MDWDTLFTMQQKLDQHIVENHNLEHKHFLEEKFLALLVELGEFANETRCFKYWSTKPPSERETILEEYVDGVHFILSLGIEKGYFFNKQPEAIPLPTDKTATEQFNDVFQAVLSFRQNGSEKNYVELFVSFLQLGKMLDFTEKDIFQAYISKNEVNFARQEDGY